MARLSSMHRWTTGGLRGLRSCKPLPFRIVASANVSPYQRFTAAACGATPTVVHRSPDSMRVPIVRARHKRSNLLRKMEAPPGFEPGMEVLQIS